ncbi:MAG TPA: SseB family protein [Gemmataceae bacterium]|jgi:predicted RNA-binding Zn-ribbon protein involved in translation (DUF1610 family)|nr:SseB family protein [Gemmataceae bacterium]
MPINVQCPSCNRKLKAKDDRAGTKVKCPSCGNTFVLPATRKVPKARLHSRDPVVQAVASGKVDEIACRIRELDFTLIETPEVASGAALMAETDDFPVMVAFTSMNHAKQFASAVPGMLDADGSMPAFVVAGKDLLTYLPEGCGVLLNPESEDSTVLSPELVEEIRGLG